jgi:hypothetical protein
MRLIGVCEHLDEEHPHLHFYSVPCPGESFGVVHQGFAAKTEARKSGLRKVGKAFVDAMKTFQDEFQEKVGILWGLARFGSTKGRKTRAEWQANQAEAAVAASALKLQEIQRAGSKVIQIANAQAAQVIAKAQNQADEIVKVETQKIRNKGAEYFGKERRKLNEERVELREERRLFIENARKTHEHFLAASQQLRSSASYHELADMRELMEKAIRSNNAGKFQDAAAQLQAALGKDLAPTLRGPKVSVWKPSRSRP